MGKILYLPAVLTMKTIHSTSYLLQTSAYFVSAILNKLVSAKQQREEDRKHEALKKPQNELFEDTTETETAGEQLTDSELDSGDEVDYVEASEASALPAEHLSLKEEFEEELEDAHAHSEATEKDFEEVLHELEEDEKEL